MYDQRTDPVVRLVDDDDGALSPSSGSRACRFDIVEAEDGVAALDAFAIFLPDIIVPDLMMPQMDDLALYQAIRALTTGRNIPIRVATSPGRCRIDRARPSDWRDGFCHQRRPSWLVSSRLAVMAGA
jgi:CheY-like chemotaxis protein